jgi:arginine deiminase
MIRKAERRIPYGCDELGRLTHVLLHRPGEELKLVNNDNYRQWLFDGVPDIERFIEEHDLYRELLTSHGVEVLELSRHLSDHSELVRSRPNLTYLHDTAVVSHKGAILSSMARYGRRNEEIPVREALTNLGVPILIDFEDPSDAFEGCLLLDAGTVLVAETERHSRKSIEKFIVRALVAFDEVIYVEVPKARRFMHPDTVYNRISNRLALAYLPAFRSTCLYTRNRVEEIDFVEYMLGRGVEIIGVSDSEQRRLACSFVVLEPGVVIHYDSALDPETLRLLSSKGVEFIMLHPDAMIAGGGSLRCITLRLHRQTER